MGKAKEKLTESAINHDFRAVDATFIGEEAGNVDEMKKVLTKCHELSDKNREHLSERDLKDALLSDLDKTIIRGNGSTPNILNVLDIPISDLVKKRIEAYNNDPNRSKREDRTQATYLSTDNVSRFIREEEMLRLEDEVEEKVQALLESLVIDTENDHNTNETAKRVAKMYLHEIFSGRFQPPPKITSFPNAKGYKSMYTTGPISIKSTCAHHLQNIDGHCWVGIIPHKEVIGLSKFNRIVHWIAHRPQIQEEMTCTIADELAKYAKTKHVAVVLKAEHHCMTSRGVREHESDMTTAVLKGAFLEDPSTKNEFYHLLQTMRGM